MNALSYSLNLDSGPMKAGLNAAKGAVAGFQNSVQSSFAAIAKVTGLLGISFAAFKSAEGIAGALKDVFAAGKELKTTSTITGQSISSLLQLRKAFQLVGLDSGSAQEALVKMQKALGGVNEEGMPTEGVFARLRLNVSALKDMNGPDAIEAIGSAISGLKTQSDRANATMQIFGRSGAEMLALFANPEAFAQARSDLGSYGEMMQRNAGLFTKITNTLEMLRGKTKKFFAGMADQIAPSLLPLLDRLKGIDLMGSGEKLGESLRGWLDRINEGITLVQDAFETGTLGELAGLSLKAGFSEAMEFLASEGKAVFDALKEPAASIVTSMVQLFSSLADLISGSITKAIVKSLRDVTIAGMEILPNSKANEANTAANNQIDAATGRIGALMQNFGKSPVGGMLTDLIKSLGVDGTKARQMIQDTLEGIKRAGNVENGVRDWQAYNQQSGGTKPSLQIPLPTYDKSSVLNDRLSKIGLFIGGAGGPQGQRALQDTAKNTQRAAAILEAQLEWHKQFGRRDGPGKF